MANKTIGQLTAKTTPASTDVFALEDTEDTKKINYDALADAILNKITSKNYTVAGSSQTLINAINTLNNNSFIKRGSVDVNTDINTVIVPGMYQLAGQYVHSPSSGSLYGSLYVYASVDANYAYITQLFVSVINGDSFIRTSNDKGSTWIGWVKQPTRTEVDTLNSRYYASRTSLQTYSFTIKRGSTGDFWFALMYIGTGPSTDGMGIYEIHIDTSNNVVIIRVAGGNGRTFTGTLSGDTLTITASTTVYGGIRVLMLDI